MKELKKIIAGLEQTSSLLKEMLSEIPSTLMRKHRIPGKWCIHEHAVHFAKVQKMLNERLRRFMTEENMEIVPYVPGASTPVDELIKADLKTSLKEFSKDRKTFVKTLKRLKPKDWRKQAKHPEYTNYTPYIMIRHLLFHDNTHMYRIEELWLTRELKKK
ncbi:MAG: DinB family protein [Nitrospinae bacterium]|nr:DinB family protein [Nitrospinota bacterium]